MATWKYEISLLVLKKYFTSEHSKQVKYFLTLKEKFCISTWSCIILYVCYVVLLWNKKLLVSDKEKGGTITVGDFINGAIEGIGLILYYVKKVICFPFFTFRFFWCQACTGILGSFSIDDGNGSENVSFKMNSRFFNLCRIYSNLLKMASVGEFPRSWFLEDHTQV